MRSSVPIFAGVLVLGGCFGVTDPGPHAGRYDLVEFDGKALPAALGELRAEPDCGPWLTAAWIELEARDYTFEATLEEGCPNDERDVTPIHEAGHTELAGEEIRFVRSGSGWSAAPERVILRGDTLSTHVGGIAALFVRR